RFGLFFGIAATVLTLGSIALAVLAPRLTSAPNLQAPRGWQQVYNDNPGTSSGLWDNASGCNFGTGGLDVASDGICAFKPTNGASLANGVLVVAQLAPAADVSVSEDAGILLDDSLLVTITQQGDYEICRGSCDLLANTSTPVVSGSTVAWHADALVANEIAVLYDSSRGTISFYANGQFVDKVDVTAGMTPSVALTTSSSGEVVFTHVAIYAGSLG